MSERFWLWSSDIWFFSGIFREFMRRKFGSLLIAKGGKWREKTWLLRAGPFCTYQWMEHTSYILNRTTALWILFGMLHTSLGNSHLSCARSFFHYITEIATSSQYLWLPFNWRIWDMDPIEIQWVLIHKSQLKLLCLKKFQFKYKVDYKHTKKSMNYS